MLAYSSCCYGEYFYGYQAVRLVITAKAVFSHVKLSTLLNVSAESWPFTGAQDQIHLYNRVSRHQQLFPQHPGVSVIFHC